MKKTLHFSSPHSSCLPGQIQKTPLKLPYFSDQFSYRWTCSKTINWSMLPYISVPFVLYIPPQCNNSNVHTLKGSKKVANRVAVYQPKQGNRHPADCFLSFTGSTGTDFSPFSQQHIFRKLTGTIISKTPKLLSKCAPNWPIGQKLTKNRTYDQTHFLRECD